MRFRVRLSFVSTRGVMTPKSEIRSSFLGTFQHSDLAFLSRQKVIRTESTLASRHRLAFDSAFTTPRGGGSFKSASANSKYSRGVTGKGIGTLLNEFESNLASSLSSTARMASILSSFTGYFLVERRSHLTPERR